MTRTRHGRYKSHVNANNANGRVHTGFISNVLLKAIAQGKLLNS
jgi:hypothetical protein